MNILYYSVHGVLEHDEISIFRSLGHNVCSLGTMKKGRQFTAYRPMVSLNETEVSFYEDYDARGGQYEASAASDDLVPEGFAKHFDVVIVMHQFHFIQQNWEKFKGLPVIWRTIGQNIENLERYLAFFRERGLKIVRYSTAELDVAGSLGFDQIIHFGKDPDFYSSWRGTRGKILSIVNALDLRLPQDKIDYIDFSSRVPSVLGGASNEAFSNWIGFKDYEEQADLLRDNAAFLFASGFDTPYTLSFIEAWMTGLPMIVYAPRDRLAHFEIDQFVEHECDGIICRTVDEAVAASKVMLTDRPYAEKLSVAGRTKAISLFGLDKIRRQWQEYLASL